MKLRDCDSCMVYGTDNRPLSRARVELAGNGAIRLFFNNFKLYSARLRTFVDFYDIQQGLVRCFCEILIQKNTYASRMEEPWMADCQILEIYDVYQRQQDLRVKTRFSIDCRTTDNEFFVGSVRNLSAGGLYIITGQAMKEGDIFFFSHRFDDVQCYLKAQVLRIKLVGSGFGYGCKFLGLSGNEEAAVRKYVFAKQIEKSRQG